MSPQKLSGLDNTSEVYTEGVLEDCRNSFLTPTFDSNTNPHLLSYPCLCEMNSGVGGEGFDLSLSPLIRGTVLPRRVGVGVISLSPFVLQWFPGGVLS